MNCQYVSEKLRIRVDLCRPRLRATVARYNVGKRDGLVKFLADDTGDRAALKSLLRGGYSVRVTDADGLSSVITLRLVEQKPVIIACCASLRRSRWRGFCVASMRTSRYRLDSTVDAHGH